MFALGVWDKIVPVCGCHQDNVELVINDRGEYSPFYSCPKYYPENRNKNEKACSNRINLIEYQKMAEHILEKVAEANMSMGRTDLTNYTWKKKGIEYKIREYSENRIVVSIVNKTALK